MKATNTAVGGIWVRADPTTRPMFPQSHACYNAIDGRKRKMEIDTEMGTEIEILMELDTEIDTDTETEIISYGDIAVANVAAAHPRPSTAV